MKKYPFHWLLLIAAIAVWQYTQNDEQTFAPQSANERPDFVANKLYSISYNEQGLPEYRIYAQSMDYFAERQIMHFAKPQILVYPTIELPIWQIQADQAKVLQQQIVALENQVVVKNLSRGDYVKDITTSYLEIDLQQQDIFSDQHVYVEGPAYQLQGRGLQGNLKDETVNLLHDIKASYQIQPQ